MHKNNYSLEVLINGRPAQEYYKGGKPFIESRRGSEYTLRFRNNSWKRVMAIISVDGIEVLKGKAASEADNGYIVDAFSSIEIKGYRIDDNNVAAFKFSDLIQGYNVVVGAEKVDKKTGAVTHDKSSKNSGVIGVRVIEEDSKDHDYAGLYKESESFRGTATFGNIPLSGCLSFTGCYMPASAFSSSSVVYMSGCSVNISANTANLGGATNLGSRIVAFGGASTYFASNTLRSNVNQMGQLGSVTSCSAIAPDFDTSTAWGTKLEDKVKEVSFKRSANVTDIEIFYASRQSLEAYGIDFSHTKQIFAWPSAFEDKKRYCKVPPGYKL